MTSPPGPLLSAVPGTAPGAVAAWGSGVGVVRGPVTYGELIDIAAAHLPAAAVAFATHPPGTALAATRTVTAYLDLLHALGTHTSDLLATGPRRAGVTEIGATAMGGLVRLKVQLARAVPSRPTVRLHAHPDTAIGHWAAAARTLRAASDLLATHRDSDRGAGRSPEAALVRYLGEHSTVLRCLAGLTVVVAETELPMRQLIASIESRDGAVRGRLPDLEAVRDAARAIVAGQGLIVDPGEYPVLRRATVARPSVRTGDPLTEITDRVRLARIHAWELLHAAEPSLDAVSDIARLATQIEATRFRITAHAKTPLSPTNAPKAGAWHALWTELRGLRGLTPPHAEIRDHARAVEHLIRDVARPGRSQTGVGASGTRRLDITDPQTRRDLAAVLRDAGDQLAQTTPWTHAALHRLTQTGHLYVPAGPAETGEGSLTWTSGKATWSPAQVPRDKIHAVNAAFRELEGAYAEGAVVAPGSAVNLPGPQPL